MNPSVYIYGGVHDDPGSRQRFLEELTSQTTAPCFIAVEWEQSVFERLALWRPQIEEGLCSHSNFLTREDSHELSLALAWEGDAYAERYPGTHVVWLENGFQQAALQRRGSDADQFARSSAHFLLQRMRKALQTPQGPRSRRDLIEAVSRDMWAEASSTSQDPADFERDARWVNVVCEHSTGLSDGWIAIVVGWAHADVKSRGQRLPDLLSSHGFPVQAVRLGPKPETRIP